MAGTAFYAESEKLLWRTPAFVSSGLSPANAPLSLMWSLRGTAWLAVPDMEEITALKRAQEQLRESERRFRMLVESIPHQVWSFRIDGALGYWNQRTRD